MHLASGGGSRCRPVVMDRGKNMSEKILARLKVSGLQGQLFWLLSARSELDRRIADAVSDLAIAEARRAAVETLSLYDRRGNLDTWRSATP